MPQTIALILAYKYYVLFPLAIFEGPILAAIAGFFISTGQLAFLPVYIIVVLGDFIGDLFLYSVGKWGRISLLNRFGNFFKITDEKLESAKKYFSANQKKTLIFSKIIHGIGITGLVAAGSLKIPYWQYMRVCLSVSVIQSAIIIVLGILFGGAYTQLIGYLNFYFATTIVVVVLVAIFIVLKKIKIKIKP